jgi:hypothetical protein
MGRHTYSEETLKAFCEELARRKSNSKPKAIGILRRARLEGVRELPTTQAILVGVKHRIIKRRV